MNDKDAPQPAMPTRDEMIAAIRADGTDDQRRMLDVVEPMLRELDTLASPLGYALATMPRWPDGEPKLCARYEPYRDGFEEGLRCVEWAPHPEGKYGGEGAEG